MLCTELTSACESCLLPTQRLCNSRLRAAASPFLEGMEAVSTQRMRVGPLKFMQTGCWKILFPNFILGTEGGKREETKHFELKATDFTQKGMISISKAETKILVGWKKIMQRNVKICCLQWKYTKQPAQRLILQSCVSSPNFPSPGFRFKQKQLSLPRHPSRSQLQIGKMKDHCCFRVGVLWNTKCFVCLKSNLQNVRQSLLDTPM